MSINVMEKYNLWVEKAIGDQDVVAELKAIADNSEKIEDAFYRNLAFGTGGLRGVIGAGTNRMNIYTVAKACQGLADFVSKLCEIPFIHVMPTQANFVLCEVQEPYTSMEIVRRMLREHNILLSACNAKKGLHSGKYLRIAIRGHEDNAKLIEAFRQL